MSEDYKVYLKKFKIAISIVTATIVIAGFLISTIVPQFKKMSEVQEQYKTQTSLLADMERKLKGLQDSIKTKKVESESSLKMFFKPINGGNDTESILSDEFGEILQIIRENKIKTRSIKYDYDPQDDNFVKNIGNKYHVCRITAEMIGNYSNFASFLRELYKHEHFLEISKVEIVPYEKNKKILLATMQIKLYAQKDVPAASAPAQPASTSEQMPDIAPENPSN